MKNLSKGPSINDVTVLGGRGMEDFVTTVLKPYYSPITLALVIFHV
jgi:hypothetical protein